MEERILEQIKSLNDRIKWAKDDLRAEIDRFYNCVNRVKEIDNLAQETHSIVSFVSDLESIKETETHIKALYEMKRCLEYILKEGAEA